MFRGIIVLVMSLMIVCRTIALGNIEFKTDICSCIGLLYDKVPEDIKKLESDKKIDILYTKDGIITDINVKDSKIIVDSMQIGSLLSSIKDVYPESWINTFDNKVVVLLGKESHYGVVTNYITYLSNDGQTISEISLGYTRGFVNKLLPPSNKEAGELLQGTWKSEKNKNIRFKQGRVSDDIFDKLYDRQEYRIISPNEMIIYRGTDNNSEKVRLRFWVTEDMLYTFVIDELGIPIEASIEKFNKVN